MMRQTIGFHIEFRIAEALILTGVAIVIALDSGTRTSASAGCLLVSLQSGSFSGWA